MKAFHAPSNRHGPASGGASRHRNACDASNGPHGPPVAPACAPTTNGADPVQTPWHGPDASLPRRPHDIAIAIAPDAGKSESKMSKAARQPARESAPVPKGPCQGRSEEHTSELQSPCNLVCRLLLEKKKNTHVTLLVFAYYIPSLPLHIYTFVRILPIFLIEQPLYMLLIEYY